MPLLKFPVMHSLRLNFNSTCYRSSSFARRHFKPISTSFGNIPTIQLQKLFDLYGSDHVLLVQMGSFYEIYGNQAQKWGPILNLKVGKKDFCGFPDYVLLNYLTALVLDHKQKVAVIRQLNGNETIEQQQTSVPFFTNSGTPSSTGMARYVNRIYSPGTFPREDLTYLAAIYVHVKKEVPLLTNERVTITFCDIGTSEMNFLETDISNLASTLNGISPVEILFDESLQVKKLRLNDKIISFLEYISGPVLTSLQQKAFLQTPKNLKNTPSSSCNLTLNAIYNYLDFVYVGNPPILSSISTISDSHAIIDKQTSNHLELLTTSARGTAAGSVFNCLDFTILKSGRKMLKRDFNFPLIELDSIAERYSCVNAFKKAPSLLMDLQCSLKALSAITPLEALCNKLRSESLGPKDIKEFLDWLKFMEQYQNRVSKIPDFPCILKKFTGYKDVIALIENTFQFEEPHKPVIRSGLLSEYDRVYSILSSTMEEIEKFKVDFRQRNSFSMKTKFPEFVGMKPELETPYIEVTPAQFRTLSKVIDIDISVLSKLESRIKFSHKKWSLLHAKYQKYCTFLLDHEKRICAEMAEKLRCVLPDMILGAKEISILDVLQSHYEASEKYCLVQPSFDTSKSRILNLKNGFHPVLHNAILKRGMTSTTNNAFFSPEKTLYIVTGPNMGGKSTYLRQIGLTIMMAQIGCFVPAKSAKLPLFKSIFTRFGSYDDLNQNKSSFMSEVAELSRILEKTSSGSIVLLDELGRGTSYADGISLFLAVIQVLLERNVYTCMTTHYRNIDKLIFEHLGAESLKKVGFLRSNLLAEKDCNGTECLRMDYRLSPGIAEHSYGLEVAGWSYLSSELLDKAKTIRSNIVKNPLHQFS